LLPDTWSAGAEPAGGGEFAGAELAGPEDAGRELAGAAEDGCELAGAEVAGRELGEVLTPPLQVTPLTVNEVGIGLTLPQLARKPSDTEAFVPRLPL
jgi:hypothetical protein